MKEITKELTDKIQSISDRDNVAIISFIAPQDAVRISPTQLAYATITENEMYELEEKISRAGLPQALHLIVHTPGGELHTSYKIAYFLRKKFNLIKAFVPYQAASGGTMICCAANELYLGDLGNITPIDPQVIHNGARVSSYAFERASDYAQNLFGELSPQEVPTPYQQMNAKFDPIIYNEMFVLTRNTYWYAKTLLEKAGYAEKAAEIAYKLTRTENVHSHSILSEEASTVGFNLKDNVELMSLYRELVTVRLKEKSATHCIDSFFPKQTPIIQPTNATLEQVTSTEQHGTNE